MDQETQQAIEDLESMIEEKESKIQNIIDSINNIESKLDSVDLDNLLNPILDSGSVKTILKIQRENLLSGSVTFNPGSLVDGAGETSSSITVTGAELGDAVVFLSAPYDLQGITATAYVDAVDSVKIRLQNETTGTIDLASGVWLVKVYKQNG